jgi:hypothetical protein
LFVDLAGEDLHLQMNSPCINAGNNAYVVGTIDLDGNLRVVGGTVDMGAYEYQGQSWLGLTAAVWEGNQLRLTWGGGAASCHLEKRSSLAPGGADWLEMPLADPTATSVLVPLTDASAFFRIRIGP